MSRKGWRRVDEWRKKTDDSIPSARGLGTDKGEKKKNSHRRREDKEFQKIDLLVYLVTNRVSHAALQSSNLYSFVSVGHKRSKKHPRQPLLLVAGLIAGEEILCLLQWARKKIAAFQVTLQE
ncbi:hypothetical protein CEXT_220001 [Caerostris extrusa]|uniref:Uncharacterized protein n=1 Tax=Caerostris extrusa TaxID=172846 RepID=A0AAV4MEY5_CAEEX|nr:hypothetical protein CEXT_220001 [Caerostris extrusa]